MALMSDEYGRRDGRRAIDRPSFGDAGRRPARYDCSVYCERAHDVSILITIGDARCRGCDPASKTSMMRIGDPQHGHGPDVLTGSSPGS